jgi:outer membrane protein assembly factor BamB
MIRAITFIPASGGTEGLTYVERASRNRSLHVLLQDCFWKGSTASHPASRRNFLRNSYREIISRYVSFGRIEHPLPLARSLVTYLENLSRRVDCRLDDFRGIGFYALFQDGDTFYLLASREGKARIRTEHGFEALGGREIPGVTELSLESTRAQKELFSQDLKDFISLYKIETGGPDRESSPLDLSLGGSGEEMDTLLEALDQPGVVEAEVPEKTIPLNLISQKMMYVRFDGLVRTRDFYDTIPVRSRSGRGRKLFGYVATAAMAVVFVSLGVLWLSERLSRPGTPDEPVALTPAPEAAAVNPALETAPPVEAGSGQATADDPVRYRLSVTWDKSYNQPVTSTPLLDDNRVFFGSRDRNFYALDRGDGSLSWRYRASAGIGASPVVAAGHVISADYRGNVFALAAEDGRRVWIRKLPEKVVSTPCVGDGEVLVGCYNGLAYALSAETGRVLWRIRTGGKIRGSCAYGGGRFYVPSYDGRVYGVTAGTGEVVWRVNLGGPVASSPAVEGDRVVVGAENGRIYCLDAVSGRVVWTYQTNGAVKSFLAFENGRIYAGSNDKSMYCLDAAGQLVWKFETDGPVFGRAAVTGDHVIFSSYDSYIYCVDAESGRLVNRFKTNGPVYSSPTIAGGHAFIGNNSGKFYCLDLQGRESS